MLGQTLLLQNPGHIFGEDGVLPTSGGKKSSSGPWLTETGHRHHQARAHYLVPQLEDGLLLFLGLRLAGESGGLLASLRVRAILGIGEGGRHEVGSIRPLGGRPSQVLLELDHQTTGSPPLRGGFESLRRLLY